MLPRFYAPDAGRSASEPLVALPEDESAHLTRVLRLGPGDGVRVFNGMGGEWRAEIATIDKKIATVRLVDRMAPAPEGRIPIVLAIAVLKSDKMDDVVRDAVMVGASAIQPLLTDRAETSAGTVSRGRRIDRWQRIAVASAKQCGRAVVPPVRPVLTLSAAMIDRGDAARVMFVEPGAAERVGRLQSIPAPAAATLFVGPEGGWSEGEVNAARDAGAVLVTMGGLTFRADAMPVIALTAVKTLWEDFS